MIELQIESGIYLFKLADILKNKNISINKLMRDTNTDFKVLKRMITGELVRIDIFVLARLCDYLDCSITDLIEYIPNKKWTETLYLKMYKFQFTFYFQKQN